MIDYVHLYLDIDIRSDMFKPKVWRERILLDGTFLYVARIRSVIFRYYPYRGRLKISGKILQMAVDSQVLNPDDVYGADIPQFVEDMNQHINTLFVGINIDICDFYVQRIDYCFNVYTGHVKEYLDFMTAAFHQANTDVRVNFTERRKLNGSVYIKTNSDYDHNSRRRYVLNYYDKSDRLHYLRRKGLRIAQDDWKYAEGVLRLEIQCGYEYIKTLLKDKDLNNSFRNMLSYSLALHAHEKAYERVFRHPGTADYYTYQAAKSKLKQNSRAAKTLKASSQGKRIILDSDHDYGRKKIIEKNICPFTFLPRNGDVDMLENPIKLIRKKLEGMGTVV